MSLTPNEKRLLINIGRALARRNEYKSLEGLINATTACEIEMRQEKEIQRRDIENAILRPED
jgi:hypothetical protein